MLITQKHTVYVKLFLSTRSVWSIYVIFYVYVFLIISFYLNGYLLTITLPHQFQMACITCKNL